ncbi:hypothetical protein C8T65DRAFT_663156 [Cerioporus squamosus]|nr:hypothetical protein C8T65DRAFT_663156 [Cerioporus squamosus]
MPTLILRTLVLLLSSASAWTVTTVAVDDSDPRILYSGAWTRNPIADPQMLNYHGTLTFTSDATALATFTFSGATQVQVFGSFPVAGTFAMHSSYSIDGTGVTPFEPPSVIGHPAYHQQFFISNTLTTGTHKLVIANLGRTFYLDYILLTLPASSTLSSFPTPTHSAAPSVPSQTTSQLSSATTTPTAESSTVFVVTQEQTNTTPQTTQDSTTSAASMSPSSLTGIPVSSSLVSITPSINAPGSTSSLPNATQNGASSSTSTGASQRSEAVVLPPGVYAAIAVGGFTVVVLVAAGLYCFLRCRRRRQSMQNDVTPFDPGLTSLASEKSPRPYARAYRASSTASTLNHDAPPYTAVDETRTPESISHDVSEEDILRIVVDERGGHTEMVAYEPLGSPSAASPLVPRRYNGNHHDSLSPLTSSPVSPASNSKRACRDTKELRRRSLDGGVRLAGGPSGNRRDADVTDVDARSAVSTLPPLYDGYTAA